MSDAGGSGRNQIDGGVRVFLSVCWTRVFECWVDCLNQDLLVFLDFRDAACLAVRMWLDERLREMYVRLREFTRVCVLSGLQFL